MGLEDIIKTAKGDNTADLVIKNAQIINVLSEEIYKADIAVKNGIIAGVGTGYNGIKEIDARRSINSKGNKRGPVKELLISNCRL